MTSLPQSRSQTVERARKLIEEAARPSPEERAELLAALHEPQPAQAPETGRLDVALALRPVRDELPVESRLLVCLVLHDWDAVVQLLLQDGEARPLLFHYLCHETPALRRWMLRHITPQFCRNDVERLLRDAAIPNFPALRSWAAVEEFRPLLTSVLTELATSPFWSLFHRGQAAALLRELGVKAPPILRRSRRLESGHGALIGSTALQEEPDPPELAPLLHALRARGLRVDGILVHPNIRVGSVTGRITYSQPPVQTWSAEERLRRIQPAPGATFVILDYSQIEPLILLNILVHRLWLAIPDLPQDDVYLWFCPEDRQLGKRIVNALINGGSPAVVDPHPKALRFIRALSQFRAEWVAECRQLGKVRTLSGRETPLPEPPNQEGKMMNRLIQGSAADLFNTAAAEVHRALTQEGWEAAVTFVLFDEIWIEAPLGQERRIGSLARRILRRTAESFCPYRAPDVRITVRR